MSQDESVLRQLERLSILAIDYPIKTVVAEGGRGILMA